MDWGSFRLRVMYYTDEVIAVDWMMKQLRHDGA